MPETESNRGADRPWLSWIALLILIGVAFALRWRYIHEISLSVDEFNTIWAARHVLVRGIPSFPSGNIYPHGFVFTYLVVPFVLGDFSEPLARLPGLIVSLAAIPVAYWVGRKLFDDRVGLIVAAVMAVDPDGILWGGRARMYGLLQLLTLLVVYLYYRGIAKDRARDRYLAMALVVVAIFTHAEAGLLLPALGVATLVAWPWRRLVRRDVILPFVVAGIGAAIFFLISKYGQQEHLDIIRESRPYLDLSADVLSGSQVFAPVFVDPHRLPFTLLALGGLVFLFRPRFDRRALLTYLYVVFFALLVPLLLLAGATWRNERYLFMLLPLLYLIAGEVLCRLLDLVPALRRTRPWQPAVLAILAALWVGLTGTHLAYQQELGYDLAFRYLRDHWEPEAGDRVVSVSPSVCAVYMGSCDYFAIQYGYEEFVVKRPGDGVLADLWAATPLLTDTAEFVDLLATAPRVWFVTDGWRLQTRYEAGFIQAVIDHMDLEYKDQGVLVFRGEGYEPVSQPAVQHGLQADFDEALALAGFGLSSATPDPGDEVEITLNWQALEQVGPAYTALLHLLAPDGTGVAGLDEPVLGGLYQPDLWPEGTTMPDRHRLTLPADLPPGRYRLDLGLYPSGQPEDRLPVAGGDRLPLATLTVGEAVPPQPTVPADITFGDQIRLLGYDLDCDPLPSTCNLSLHWQAIDPVDRDYTVFVHLTDPDGTIISQDDAPPGDPFFPTSTWPPGYTVVDSHVLTLPADAPPGTYSLLTGLYHPPTEERLQAVDAGGSPLGDALLLTTLTVGSESP